jgi:hypothetical protein
VHSIARLVALAAVLVLLVSAMVALPLIELPDARVYYLAGERLNSGHSAYVLTAGDLPIPAASAVAWANVGLLSPPPIAVLWRPLAAVGEWTVVAWTVAARAALVVAVVVLVWRSWPTAFLVLIALEPMIWLGAVGNVHAFVVLGTLLLWLWRDRPWPAAALAVSMAAVKLTPVVLVIWLARDRRTWLPIAVIGLAWLAACALFGGRSLGEYLDVMALGGQRSNWIVLGLGLVAVVVLPQRFAFAAAVLTSVFATSVLGIHWLALLPVAAAPWLIPERPGRASSAAAAVPSGTAA